MKYLTNKFTNAVVVAMLLAMGAFAIAQTETIMLPGGEGITIGSDGRVTEMTRADIEALTGEVSDSNFEALVAQIDAAGGDTAAIAAAIQNFIDNGGSVNPANVSNPSPTPTPNSPEL